MNNETDTTTTTTTATVEDRAYNEMTSIWMALSRNEAAARVAHRMGERLGEPYQQVMIRDIADAVAARNAFESIKHRFIFGNPKLK